MAWPLARLRGTPVVAVVRLAGVIGSLGPWRGGLSLAGLAGTLERAFALGGIKAVALAINSPGGSPVQSSLIAARIRALASEKKLPVFAFAEDVAASGGYWLATAGDEIYADESSIVGSIGVISAGFGFPELLQRLGVERRVHTAGVRKSMLDPFRPESPEDVARLEALQGEIHDSFKAHVRERRGARLKADDDTLFSGEFWSGKRALPLRRQGAAASGRRPARLADAAAASDDGTRRLGPRSHRRGRGTRALGAVRAVASLTLPSPGR
jgi:signal peptide peptidase SppA